MIVCGIDPGVTGGIAWINHGDLIAVAPMPVYDGRCSGSELADTLRDIVPDVVVVERTQPMPKNGSIASYSLGMNTGIVFGVVETLRHPLVKIRPVDWKRANGLVGRDKNASRALAIELWPASREHFRRVKDDGKAEAALIARAHIFTYIKEANRHAASAEHQ